MPLAMSLSCIRSRTWILVVLAGYGLGPDSSRLRTEISTVQPTQEAICRVPPMDGGCLRMDHLTTIHKAAMDAEPSLRWTLLATSRFYIHSPARTTAIFLRHP